MKNHWHVDCSNCGQQMRLTVEDKDLGRVVNAVCPKCRTQTKTTIGKAVENDGEPVDVPSEVTEAVEELAKEIANHFRGHSKLKDIERHGFGFMLALGIYKRRDKKNAEVEMKVDEHNAIKVGTFTEDDEKLLREIFKIKL